MVAVFVFVTSKKSGRSGHGVGERLRVAVAIGWV